MCRMLWVDRLADVPAKSASSRLPVVWLRLVTSLVVSGLLLGCGGKFGPQRVAVDGAILSADKLLPNGTIRFLPEPGNNSPIAITTVQGGLYRFTKADGPFPGRYTVAVNLELDYSELSKMSSSSSEPPPMTWEAKATVPDQKTATLHFDWPAGESTAKANVPPNATQ